MIETRQAKLAAVALIFNEDKTMLLGVSRKDNHALFGLPGGKVDIGESMHEGVIREVKEETGIDVKSAAPVFLREEDKSNLNADLAALKTAHSDQDLTKIEEATEKLNQTWATISAKLYHQAQQGENNGGSNDPEVQDADYEEVK